MKQRRVNLDLYRVAVAQLLGQRVELPEPLPERCHRHELPDGPGDPLAAAWCDERGLPKFFGKPSNPRKRRPHKPAVSERRPRCPMPSRAEWPTLARQLAELRASTRNNAVFASKVAALGVSLNAGDLAAMSWMGRLGPAALEAAMARCSHGSPQHFRRAIDRATADTHAPEAAPAALMQP